MAGLLKLNGGRKMNKIFNDAKDEHVSAYYIYGKASDTKAYADAGCTVQMKTSELKEAFIKRAIIVIGDDIYIPVSFGLVSKAGTVKYIKPNSSTATSADLGTLTAATD